MKSRKKSRSQGKKRQYKKTRSGPCQFLDLSDFEDAGDSSFFQKIVQAAAKNAVNENKALNIPITFFLDGWVVQRMPNGDILKIIEVQNGNRVKNRRIAKGTILHVNRSTDVKNAL